MMKLYSILIFLLSIMPYWGLGQGDCQSNAIIEPPDIAMSSGGFGKSNYPKKMVPLKDKYLLASVFNNRDSMGKIIDQCGYILLDACGAEIKKLSHPNHHFYQNKKQTNIHYANGSNDSILVCYSNPNLNAYWVNDQLEIRPAFSLDSFPYSLKHVVMLDDTMVLMHYLHDQKSILALYTITGNLLQTISQTPLSQSAGFKLQQIAKVGSKIIGIGTINKDSTHLFTLKLNTNFDSIVEQLIPLPSTLKLYPQNHAFCLSNQDSNLLQMAMVHAGKADIYNIQLSTQLFIKLGAIQHPHSNILSLEELVESGPYFGLKTADEFYVTDKQLKLVSVIPYSFDSTIQAIGNNARGYEWKFESNLLFNSLEGSKMAVGGGYNYWGLFSKEYISMAVRKIKSCSYTPFTITAPDTFYKTNNIISVNVSTPSASSLDEPISGKWFLSKALLVIDKNPHRISLLFPAQQPLNSLDSITICYQYYYNGSAPTDTCKKIYLVNGKIDKPNSIEDINKEDLHFDVFPNPIQDYLNINAPKNSLLQTLEILDLEGRTVFHSNLGSIQMAQIDIGHLKSGCYLLFINSHQKAYKIIKQ